MVVYRVLRQQDGDRLYQEGETRTLDRTDAIELVRLGALAEIEGEEGDELDGELRAGGPTITEFVAAGYPALAYPPRGYAAVSTPDEIDAAIAAQASPSTGGALTGDAPLEAVVPASAVGDTGSSQQENEIMSAEEKAAQKSANKAAPLPANKAAPVPANKTQD